MRVPWLLICAILGVAIRGQAHAARNVEVVQQPSLLMFGEVNQLLGMNYSFTEHANSSTSSSSSSLAERYSLSTVAAVFDPDLATIQLDLGISYQQAFSEQTTTFLNAQYNIVTTAFGASSHPVTIISTRDTSLVDNGFTPAYTLTRNTVQMSASLLHEVLPLQFSYGHSSSDSTGLSENFSTTTDAVALNATHTVPNLSTSLVSFDFATESSNGQDTSSYSLLFDNGLTFDKQRRFILNSKVQRQDSKSNLVPQRSFTLSEALSCRFGQALLGNLSYDFSDSSTVDFQQTNQNVRTNTVSASLGHRLYASLTTGVTGTYTKSEAFGGSSSTYGGTANMNYFKLLPRQSSLALLGSFSRKITDQSQPVDRITVTREKHLVAQQGDFIVLDTPGTLEEVTLVESLLSDNPTIPDTTYLEGADYLVDPQGRIRVVVGGNIAPGTVLRISYRVQVNPSIKFQSDTYNTGFILTLLSGRYTLGGDLALLKESLLAGEAQNVPLSRSTNLSLRADARFTKSSLGVDYAYSDSNSQRFSKVGAHYNYATQISRTDFFSFNARNDFFIYPAQGAGGAGYTENTFSAGANYGTLLLNLVRASLVVGVNDSRSQFGSGDTVTGKLSLDADYRRLTLSINAITMYRITGSAANRDSNISLTVTRSF